MTPTPSPSVPVEVFVHSGPAEWWQVLGALGPLAVLTGAVIAGLIGWNTLKQRAVADNRAEWWTRTQWALDTVNSGDSKRATMGLKVLKVLAESELAGEGELAVLEAAWEDPLKSAETRMSARILAARVRQAPENGGHAAEGEGPPGAAAGRRGAHPATSPETESLEASEEADRTMAAAAAQLRLVTDRRLGKQTPEWVKALAADKPGDTR